MQVEDRAVVEEAAPLGIEANQVQVIFELLAGLGEDASQHRRQGQDRRPHVEAIALLLEDRRLAPEPTIPLEQDDAIPSGGERARGRQSSQPAADDADPIACWVVVICF